MDAVTAVPAPANEPVHTYAPGSPERERLTAKLKELAAEPVDVSHVLGGEHVHGEGDRFDIVQPHNHRAVLGTLRNATPRGRDGGRRGGDGRGSRVAGDVVRRPRGRAAAGRRPARRAVAGDRRGRDHARAVQVGAAGGDRRAVRTRRLLALQRALRPRPARRPAVLVARRVEPDGLPAARGIRVRDHPVQLHRDRREPAHRSGAAGQHRGVEARTDAVPGGVLDDAPARGGGGCRPA